MKRRELLRAAGLVTAAGRAAGQISFPQKPARKAPPKAEIVSVDRIWDRAPHNAFTDLVRFRERWYLAFREGSAHVSRDGAIRVLTSFDAARWESTALLTYPIADLRDPKLSVTPDQRLMLTSAGAFAPPFDVRHKSLVWSSRDGRDWGSAEMIGDPDVWLWRVTWHEGLAYSFGYSTTANRFLRAYISADGREFRVHNPALLTEAYPNESSIVFLPGDRAVCLLRRDEGSKTALLGSSRPPYRAWTWQDLGVRIGGPHMIRLAGGRLVAAVRLHDGRTRTSLCWVDPETPALTEFLALPSGGDCSYAGMVFHNELLHVSYYSSHESRASVYLAKVSLPPVG